MACYWRSKFSGLKERNLVFFSSLIALERKDTKQTTPTQNIQGFGGM
jgi:hypothetical protein